MWEQPRNRLEMGHKRLPNSLTTSIRFVTSFPHFASIPNLLVAPFNYPSDINHRISSTTFIVSRWATWHLFPFYAVIVIIAIPCTSWDCQSIHSSRLVRQYNLYIIRMWLFITYITKLYLNFNRPVHHLKSRRYHTDIKDDWTGQIQNWSMA